MTKKKTIEPQSNQVERFKIRFKNEGKQLKFAPETYETSKAAKDAAKALKAEHKDKKLKCSEYSVRSIYVQATLVKSPEADLKTETKTTTKEN